MSSCLSKNITDNCIHLETYRNVMKVKLFSLKSFIHFCIIGVLLSFVEVSAGRAHYCHLMNYTQRLWVVAAFRMKVILLTSKILHAEITGRYFPFSTGVDNFYDALEDMMGYRPNAWMKWSWTVITPLLCMVRACSHKQPLPLLLQQVFCFPKPAPVSSWSVAFASHVS